MKNKINLEVTTSQANFLLDALDVYLKQLRDNTDEHCQIKATLVGNGLKKCSLDAYFQGEKFRRNLHNILTEKGYEESQAKLHKEADKEIWGDNNER